jgi:hypothetical protein
MKVSYDSLGQLPYTPLPTLLLGACLLGCGGADGANETGSQSTDAGVDGRTVDDATLDDATLGIDASEAPDASTSPDADPCAGVRCAGPPVCGQPCTTSCCCSATCVRIDGGSLESGAPISDGGRGEPGAECTHPSDCRLFSDTCGACTCVALGASAADPTCPGPAVQCFRDPCSGQSAVCSGGHCALQMP